MVLSKNGVWGWQITLVAIRNSNRFTLLLVQTKLLVSSVSQSVCFIITLQEGGVVFTIGATTSMPDTLTSK